MSSSNRTNQQLARLTLEALRRAGVRTLLLCPGARNSPWIEEARSFPEFELLFHFEERAAGFFALGRARATDSPVAVVTTSGTAVGELLPALMEAFHGGGRLWVLSADRPARFRGTGAPQACEQPGIFGSYTRSRLDCDRTLDPGVLELAADGPLSWPRHWNVCFEEPLPSHEKNREAGLQTVRTLPEDFRRVQRPLVILGELTAAEGPLSPEGVLAQLLEWRFPVVAESLSQLREEPSLEPLRLQPHRGLWDEALASGYRIDGVIRIGGVPTHRLWRDLEVLDSLAALPVWSVSELPFSGLPRAHCSSRPDPGSWPKPLAAGEPSVVQWKAANAAVCGKLAGLLAREAASEPGCLRTFSEFLPPASAVYLGNSLPIREWDLAASPRSKSLRVTASRGLNGIDGQLSTFLGAASAPAALGVPHWAVLGDLTTLYDSTAPWILPQLLLPHWHLLIINNGGGRIFERIFGKPEYLHSHELDFEAWARHWGLSYARVPGEGLARFLGQERPDDDPLPRVLELVPDPESTARFWAEWETSR